MGPDSIPNDAMPDADRDRRPSLLGRGNLIPHLRACMTDGPARPAAVRIAIISASVIWALAAGHATLVRGSDCPDRPSQPESGFNADRPARLAFPSPVPASTARHLSPLRPPRRSTVLWGPVRGNDPTDDGTSDNPEDDDDGWDDLSAAEDTEAPGTAWFEPALCPLDQLVVEVAPAWNYHPFATSVLSLQKLRC
jgi:hypothetical protein